MCVDDGIGDVGVEMQGVGEVACGVQVGDVVAVGDVEVGIQVDADARMDGDVDALDDD